jgi:hypothetical protein
MFESICIGRRDFLGGLIDFGNLAEALVFYREVHLLSDQESFKSLVRKCGSDVVLELCEMGSLRIHYAENATAIGSRDISPAQKTFGLVTFKIQNQSFLNDATRFLAEYFGPSGKGFRRSLGRFTRAVRPFEHARSALDDVQSDLPNKEYVRASVRGVLSSLVPEYLQPDPLVFDIVLNKSTGEFGVETNIDFAAANDIYHRGVSSEESSLSEAFILAHILGTRTSLDMASGLSSDLSLGPVSSIIGTNKIASLVNAHQESRSALEHFVEMTVSDCRAISHAVQSGERNFGDVLKLVHSSQKFKDWLAKQDADKNVYDEYCRAVSRVDWADRLPAKSVRWLLFNAAGLALAAVTSPAAGAAVGVGLSAADTFLLDKLLKGWKPNQFVEGPLKEFIRVR